MPLWIECVGLQNNQALKQQNSLNVITLYVFVLEQE